MRKIAMLKKEISIKYLYIICIVVFLIIITGLYTTYAMFTASVNTNNVVNLIAGTTYNYNINGINHFNVASNSIATFNVDIKNTTDTSMHYEIYYSSNDTLTNVIIGEVVEDANVTTTALNTSGTISPSGNKVVPLTIKNDSDSAINITIGVVSTNVGGTINYGNDGYPIGTKITSTFGIDDTISTNGCVKEEKVENRLVSDTYKSYKVYYYSCDEELIGNNLDQSGANIPVLADGMIPIRYDSTCNNNAGCWVKADKNNTNSTYKWYDYNNKLWANAVMVKENATNGVTNSKARSEYISADAGTQILDSDILAYYVWIPRYSYRLFNTSFASITARSIEISFEKSTKTSNGTCNGQYNNPTDNCWYTHPAFTFGEDNLDGIWVGKFEVSSDTTCTAANYSAVGDGCNNRDYKPKILPGVTSWRGAMTSTFYLAAKKIEEDTTYLTTIGKSQVDSHMMKNMEWGAVAYLSYSVYGKNSEIAINNNGSTFYSGGGISNTYKTSTDQSTTGNITGIYDISGNAYEYVMGVQKDNVSGSGKPMSGYQATNNYHSGFNGKSFNGTTWSDYTGGVNFTRHKIL